MKNRFSDSVKQEKIPKNSYSIYQQDYQWKDPTINNLEIKSYSLKMRKTNFKLGSQERNKNLISTKQKDYNLKIIPNKDVVHSFKLNDFSKITMKGNKNDFMTSNRIEYNKKPLPNSDSKIICKNKISAISNYPKEKNPPMCSVYKSNFVKPTSEQILNGYSKEKIKNQNNKLRCSSINLNVGHPRQNSTMKDSFKPFNVEFHNISGKVSKPFESFFKIGFEKNSNLVSSNQADYQNYKLKDFPQNPITSGEKNKTHIFFGFNKNNYSTEANSQFIPKLNKSQLNKDSEKENKISNLNLNKTNFTLSKDKTGDFQTSYKKNFVEFSLKKPEDQEIKEKTLLNLFKLRKSNWNFGNSKNNWETEFRKK